MKKQILVFSILLGLFLVSSVMALGTEKSMPMQTANGVYSSTLFGGQSYKVQWVPCMVSKGKTISCKQTILVDNLAVVPTGQVKPSTSYTLVVNTKESAPKQVTCIANKISSSTSIKQNGKWVKAGYLNINVQYNWTPLLTNGKNDRFYLVESSKVDCNAKKITTYNLNDILTTNAI